MRREVRPKNKEEHVNGIRGFWETVTVEKCLLFLTRTVVVRGIQLPFQAGTDLLAVGELRSTTSSPRGPRQQ